jgi:hypothetical protein
MLVLLNYLKWYGIGYASVYAFLFLFVRFLSPLPVTHLFTTGEWRMHFSELALFSAVWAAIMFALYFILSFGKKVDFKEVFLHMGVIALLGPPCEVITNTFCRIVFGTSLWVYHVLPVHGGDTSKYSFCVWAIYGCHLYFMDKKFIHTHAAYRYVLFALMLSVDAVILEFLLNLSGMYYLHSYVFYYFPNDILHLTTLAVVPFYFLGGLCAAYVIQKGVKQPVITGLFGLLSGYVFVFVL